MSAPFAALFEALSAYVQGDGERVRDALVSAPAHALYGQAVRHKCGALLFQAIADHRIRDARTGALFAQLQQYAATCALDAAECHMQLAGVVRGFKDAGVTHALLKSAAGLYVGDKVVERSRIFDLDVFVPREQAEAAAAALHAEGYRYADPHAVPWYRMHHHHLTPLLLPSFKRPVEVHVQLAPPGWFSTPSDWQAFDSHFEEINGAEGPALRLDAYGRCVHWALHGAHLRRLNDAVNLAMELRRSSALLDALFALSQRERVQRVALQSAICAAAQMAGLQAPFDAEVRRFVRWAIEREDLPRGLRDRTQLADAWFANGGTLRGPATPFAMSCPKTTAAGRVLAGMLVMARGSARVR